METYVKAELPAWYAGLKYFPRFMTKFLKVILRLHGRKYQHWLSFTKVSYVSWIEI